MSSAYIEVTDTYGGEANYCWCDREYLKDIEGLSTLQVIRRLKHKAGLSGIRWRKVAECGDYIQYKMVGYAVTAFIIWEY